MTVLLFAGETYYPRGGWADLVAVFPTVDSAVTHAEKMAAESDAVFFAKPPVGAPRHIDWWHVVEDNHWVCGASMNYKNVPKGTEQIWWEPDERPWWQS